MVLLYAGEERLYLDRIFKKRFSKIEAWIIYTGTKLSSQFYSAKDVTLRFEEQHDVLYHFFCVKENCNESYIGKTELWLNQITKNNNS